MYCARTHKVQSANPGPSVGLQKHRTAFAENTHVELCQQYATEVTRGRAAVHDLSSACYFADGPQATTRLKPCGPASSGSSLRYAHTVWPSGSQQPQLYGSSIPGRLLKPAQQPLSGAFATGSHSFEQGLLCFKNCQGRHHGCCLDQIQLAATAFREVLDSAFISGGTVAAV